MDVARYKKSLDKFKTVEIYILLDSDAMQLFQVILKYSAVIGLKFSHPIDGSPFNHRNRAVLIIFGFSTIYVTYFLLFDAKSLREYAETFFLWITFILTFGGVFVGILNSTNFCRLIKGLETAIENGMRYSFIKIYIKIGN